MKNLIRIVLCQVVFISCISKKQEILPIPSTQPNKAQLAQIERQYGMFIHFGVNTFVNMEWTNGSVPATAYNPTVVNAEQWIKSAKDAGMKYVILITKHHDGFCLWDSKYTDYDVANSKNTTDVVEAVAKACKKYNIGLGLYYSLWDRKADGDIYITKKHPFKYAINKKQDSLYNSYLLKQINELIDITEKHTPLVEFWFDGGWTKANTRWPLKALYQTIKSREPLCQIGINHTIGLPENPDFHGVYPPMQKEGFPIRYFPSDFRLCDPHLPMSNDPKIFTHNSENYYMPWETTVCMSKKWFYNTTDTVFKSVDELAMVYRKATAQNNILILNCPPNRDGVLRDQDIELLRKLKERLKIDN